MNDNLIQLEEEYKDMIKQNVLRDIAMALLQVSAFPRDNWEFSRDYVRILEGLTTSAVHLEINGQKFIITVEAI